MRAGIEFSKTGSAKYISHLDLQRAFGRAVRRSGLPVSMSQGFNPHYIISFASALALGTQSEAECVETELKEEVNPELILEKLSCALPQGLKAKRVVILGDSAPKLMANLREALYEVKIHESSDFELLKSAVCDIMGKSSVVVTKKSKGTEKQIDIRPLIMGIEATDGVLLMRLSAAPTGSLRPELVLEELKKTAGEFDYTVTRTGLFAYRDGKAIDLLEACAKKGV